MLGAVHRLGLGLRVTYIETMDRQRFYRLVLAGGVALAGLGYGAGAQAQTVRVTSLADYNFPWTGYTTRNLNDNTCAFRNPGTGTYRVTATGSGSGGAFTLSSGGFNLPYQVRWNNRPNTSGMVQLASGVERAFNVFNISTATCGSGLNANLHIRVLGTAMQAVPAGTYTGTVSIRLRP